MRHEGGRDARRPYGVLLLTKKGLKGLEEEGGGVDLWDGEQFGDPPGSHECLWGSGTNPSWLGSGRGVSSECEDGASCGLGSRLL